MAQVKVETMLIESDMVAKAILDLIPVLNIRKLVIGTTKSSLRYFIFIPSRNFKLRIGNPSRQFILFVFCQIVLMGTQEIEVQKRERHSRSDTTKCTRDL